MFKKEHHLVFNDLKIYVAEYGQVNDDKVILALHGAGGSSSERTSYLWEMLADEGYYILAPDFIGHGKSDGELTNSSLQVRYEVAKTVVNNFGIQKAHAVIGSSMGAQTSIDFLRDDFRIDNLILIVPGIYDEAAWPVKFDESFSKIIRKEKSWLNSFCWNLLGDFTQSILIISAENDSIIPKEIPQKLINSSMKSYRKAHIIIKNANHGITKKLGEDQNFCFEFKNILASWIESGDFLQELEKYEWK